MDANSIEEDVSIGWLEADEDAKSLDDGVANSVAGGVAGSLEEEKVAEALKEDTGIDAVDEIETESNKNEVVEATDGTVGQQMHLMTKMKLVCSKWRA
jgi:hypothetical protein